MPDRDPRSDSRAPRRRRPEPSRHGPRGRRTGSSPPWQQVASPGPSARTAQARTRPGPSTSSLRWDTGRSVDSDDPRWGLDPFDGAGVSESQYTTYGPLTVPPDTLLTRFASSARLSWGVQPELGRLTAGELATVQDGLGRFGDAVAAAPSFSSGVQVVTGLDGLLVQASRAVLVSRSTTPVPQLLLAALAAYAVCYVGWLLHGQRRGERALLSARGASGGQSARAALAEAALLVVPAALVAPWLAGALLRWAAGPLGLVSTGFRPPDAVPAGLWPAMVLVAAVAVLALCAPALLARDPLARPGRPRSRPGLRRAGADLGLLVLAGLCYLQLRSAGSPFTSADVRGLAVNPVYVAAPVLLLAAIALLGLRLLPPLARTAERLAARGSAAVPALGVWPVSRRPLRHAGPLLLLVIALSVGLLAAVSTATGERSRADQADFAVGADVRVQVPTRSSVDSQGTGARLRRLPGVAAVMPVLRDLVDTGSGSGSTTTLLALDSRTAPEVVQLRPDLAGAAPTALYAPLQQPGPDGLALPEGTTSLRLHGRIAPAGRPDPDTDFAVALAVRDRTGLTHVLPLGSITANGRDHALAAALGPDTTQAVALVVDPPQGYSSDAPVELRLAGVQDQDDRPVLGPGSLVDTTVGIDGQAGAVIPLRGPGAADPAGAGGGATLPAIATVGLLHARAAAVGDTVNTTIRGTTVPVRIVAAVDAFPTVTSGEGLVVDLGSLQQRLLAADGRAAEPAQWWLRAPGPAAAGVTAAIDQQRGLTTEVVDRFTVRDALQDDPLALGFQGALRIALVAGVLFAAVGFGVSVLLSAQERRGDLALFRALGMAPRQVAATLWLEQGLVLGLGMVLGLAVGLVVSLLIVPLTTVSSRTGAVVPPAITTVPWAQTAVLVASLLVILGVTLAAATRAAQRGRTAAALRVEDLA